MKKRKRPGKANTTKHRIKAIQFNSSYAHQLSDSVIRMTINCNQFDWLFSDTNSQLNIKFQVKRLGEEELTGAVSNSINKTTDKETDEKKDEVNVPLYSEENHLDEKKRKAIPKDSTHRVTIKTTDEEVNGQIDEVANALSGSDSFESFSFILSPKHFSIKQRMKDIENPNITLSAIRKDSIIKIISTH